MQKLKVKIRRINEPMRHRIVDFFLFQLLCKFKSRIILTDPVGKEIGNGKDYIDITSAIDRQQRGGGGSKLYFRILGADELIVKKAI